SSPPPFNGATANRPWEVPVTAGCGHKLEPSMGPRPTGRGRISFPASSRSARDPSMGPRPTGRGRAAWRRRRTGTAASFNGATAHGPWEAAAARDYRAEGGPLQWGHGQPAVGGQ